ncbi:hypothetical protein AVEN_83191-1 [Araneus ventricosus]|uniref:Uncharacterized protein n=1 Tax=Araneus ventricosus TaxID=182803 RepID=A0A4Y2API0_ARAVE|nr:hypothetical protein AVEN_83191-1 [Araneus ventricosus]
MVNARCCHLTSRHGAETMYRMPNSDAPKFVFREPDIGQPAKGHFCRCPKREREVALFRAVGKPKLSDVHEQHSIHQGFP